jgi:hypothetical protein
MILAYTHIADIDHTIQAQLLVSASVYCKLLFQLYIYYSKGKNNAHMDIQAGTATRMS